MLKRYTAIKLARFFLSLGIVVFLHFIIPRLMPGSPVTALLGPDSIGLSHKDYAALEEEFGLDRPLFQQFITHASNTIRGDVGFSYSYHRPVAHVVWEHMKPTLLILFPSVLLSSFFAILLGTVAGRFSGKIPDIMLTTAFLFIYAMPAFLIAMVSLKLFAYHLTVFPLGGLKSMDVGMGIAPRFMDMLWHLILPILVLSFSSIGAKFLVMRNSVIENKDRDYVLYARARGMGECWILFIHILRNASLPMVSLVGLHFAFILSGSLLVEIVFSINGMGSLIYDAAISRDYPMLQGCFLLLTLVVLVVNLVLDLLYGLLDPRVRT
jgi:peptide/nickel transport system permease protein